MSKDLDNREQKPRASRPTQKFGTETERIQKNEAGARLIAKVIRDVLTSKRFADAGDLRDAVESRCRSLGMAFDRPQVERAMDLVGSNTQLLQAQKAPSVVARADNPTTPEISATEAKAILDRLGIRVSGGRIGASGPVKKSRLEAL